MSERHDAGAVMPADVEAPDKIVWGFTFRQIAVLAASGSAGWGLWRLVGDQLPAAVWVAVAIPGIAVAAVVALSRRDGLPMDAWLAYAVAFLHRPSRLATGHRGPTLTRTAKPKHLGLLRLPATAIDDDGTITAAGHATVLVATGTANLALRTAAEQVAVIDGYGRWLNTLTTPTQIVVSTRPMDLHAHADGIDEHAESVVNPRLRAAAAEHAAFLRKLGDSRAPLRRQVLVAVTGRNSTETARRAADTARALAGLGIQAQPLPGPVVTAVLAAACDPTHSPTHSPADARRAVPGQPIGAPHENQNRIEHPHRG